MKKLDNATLRTKDLKGHKMNIQLFAEGGDDDNDQGGNEITLESVQKFLNENEEGQQWLQSHTDSRVTKGIETFKEKSMPKILQEKIEEKIKELNPEETEEQKRLRKIEEEFEKEKQARKLAELTSKAKDLAEEKKVPLKLVNYFIGEDEEKTKENIELFATVIEDIKKNAVEEVFKGNGRHVHNNNNNSNNDNIGKTYAEQRNQQTQTKSSLWK